jgi:hypothetical protein
MESGSAYRKRRQRGCRYAEDRAESPWELQVLEFWHMSPQEGTGSAKQEGDDTREKSESADDGATARAVFRRRVLIVVLADMERDHGENSAQGEEDDSAKGGRAKNGVMGYIADVAESEIVLISYAPYERHADLDPMLLNCSRQNIKGCESDPENGTG